MRYSKKMKILICYESDCGGETLATEYIINEFKQNSKIQFSCYYLKPLKRTASWYLYTWVILSIYKWIIGATEQYFLYPSYLKESRGWESDFEKQRNIQILLQGL